MQPIRFIPMTTFEHEGSVYVDGMLYTADNPQLLARAYEWRASGKVRFVAERPRAIAAGKLETR